MNTQETRAPVDRNQDDAATSDPTLVPGNAVLALLTTILATQSVFLLAVLWASPLSATGAVTALVARL